MMNTGFRRRALALTVVASTLALAPILGVAPAAGEEYEDGMEPMRFRAIALNIGNVGPRGSGRLDIVINRWSTTEEVAELKEAIQGGGPTALSRSLRGMERVGFVREVSRLSNNLRFSRSIPTENGERIILATDRPLSFAEVWRSTRSQRYNVTLIQLDLDYQGIGTGSIMLGAQFAWDEEGDRLVIESFSSEPIRLTSVELR